MRAASDIIISASKVRRRAAEVDPRFISAGAADIEESMADSSPDNIIDVSDNEDDIGDASDNAAEMDVHGNPVLRSPFKRHPSQRREHKK